MAVMAPGVRETEGVRRFGAHQLVKLSVDLLGRDRAREFHRALPARVESWTWTFSGETETYRIALYDVNGDLVSDFRLPSEIFFDDDGEVQRLLMSWARLL